MSIRVGINGFGRIGRTVFRALTERARAGERELEVVAVNDLGDARTLAHLLRHDSVRGRFGGTVEARDDALVVDGQVLWVLAENEPAVLPWRDLEVDVVVESSGRFTEAEAARAHLAAGARKVVVSAASHGADLTVVMGINDESYDGTQAIVSGASCTTNCVAPMAKVLHDTFGLVTGFMTTVHAYTGGQRLQDAPHKDLRRARAAAANIIPTTTGAAGAIVLVLPALAGRLDGLALRVPVPDGSVTDLTATLSRNVTVDEVNAAFRAAAEGQLKSILDYTEEPVVSSDIIGSTASCIVDAGMTKVLGDSTVKILGWYDNEWAYAHRVVDLATLVGGFHPREEDPT
jgi:glyceraldehyde 3-phosphate dehydrogenase